MDWIEGESFGFGSPAFTDELVGREALEGLQSSSEVVRLDEVLKMSPQLGVVIVMEALDGRVFDRAVQPLDLAVRPGVLRLGQPVLNVQLGTGVVEGMSAEEFALGDGFLDLGND